MRQTQVRGTLKRTITGLSNKFSLLICEWTIRPKFGNPIPARPRLPFALGTSIPLVPSFVPTFSSHDTHTGDRRTIKAHFLVKM